MKEELINSIVSMLQSTGIEPDGIADRLSDDDLEAAHRKYVV